MQHWAGPRRTRTRASRVTVEKTVKMYFLNYYNRTNDKKNSIEVIKSRNSTTEWRKIIFKY